MQIGEISNQYKKMLDDFFQDEDVKENMLKAYFGEERYYNNKQTYDKLYYEKINKIIFIPYITLDDFNHFISTKNYKNNKKHEEVDLLNRLKKVRNDIVKSYSKILYDEVKNVYKNIPEELLGENNRKIERAINEYKNGERNNSSITDEFECIKRYLNEQLDIKTKNPIINNIKNKKIKKALKIIDDTEDTINKKILMETSSFYENRQHTSSGNSKKSIDISLIGKAPCTCSHIYKNNGKLEDEYYVYMPIGKANSKQNLLDFSVHEVGHVLKSKINNNKITSGFSQAKIKKDGSIVSAYENMRNTWSKINVRLGQNENYNKNLYKYFEEFMHEFFTEVAINNMKQETKQKLNHPYGINEKNSMPISLYKDRTDENIVEFINNFKEQIQEVNATANIKKFRSIVGKDKFDNLVVLMKKDLNNREKQNPLYPLIKAMGRARIEKSSEIQKLVQEEEAKIKMEDKIKWEIGAVCKDILTRKQVVKQTKNIPMSLIVEMGEMIKSKSSKKKYPDPVVSFDKEL